MPAIAILGLLYYLPLLINGALAFTDWSGFKRDITFVGLDNFEALGARLPLLRQIQLTLLYAVSAMLVANGMALTLALALERSTRVNTFFRSVFFIPVLFSSLAAGYIWSGILDPRGPLNELLSLAFPGFDRAWLGDAGTAIFLVAAIDAWKYSGFFTLVYIAALKAVPDDLKDAARVDGASGWRIFRDVKFPLLAPAVTFNVTVSLIGAMSSFDVIVASTRGGPGDATRVLNILTLDQFGSGFYGLASTTTLVVTVLVIATAIPLVTLLRRREVEG